MKLFDMRTDKKRKPYRTPYVKTGVVCKTCEWRGYRIVLIRMDRLCQIDRVACTSLVKGVRSHGDCPKCYGPVVYTHVTGYRVLR